MTLRHVGNRLCFTLGVMIRTEASATGGTRMSPFFARRSVPTTCAPCLSRKPHDPHPEAARLLGVHENTVRYWHKRRATDGQRFPLHGRACVPTFAVDATYSEPGGLYGTEVICAAIFP